MANKYIIHGATYCGNGLASTEAASAGAAGAWNDINVFEGAPPAYGTAPASGDVVYIRSKTSVGADITRTNSSGSPVYLGSATATANNPITWIIDDGTIWPGAGVLKYQTSVNTNRISFRANNFFKSTLNNLRFATTQTSESAGDGYPWVEVHGVVEGLHFDTRTYTNTVARCCIAFGDGGTLVNPVIKLGARYSGSDPTYAFFSITVNRGDLHLINPDVELTSVGLAPSGLFGIPQSYPRNYYVYGGRVYGAGANVENQVLCSQAGSYCSGLIKLVGFEFPRSMKVVNNPIGASQASASAGTHIEIIGCDGGIGGHHEACWGWMTSRTDNNPPYLSAFGLDSELTAWAWRVYPYSPSMQSPMHIPAMKMYTDDSSVKTISQEVLVADTLVPTMTKASLWFSVGYTDTSDIQRSENTRDSGALADSLANWSAEVWGMIALVKKSLSLTTKYAIKKDTVITLTLYGYAKAASVNDVLFVDPDFGVN